MSKVLNPILKKRIKILNDFLQSFHSNDFLPGRDVVMTFETLAHPLDMMTLKKVVEEITNV